MLCGPHKTVYNYTIRSPENQKPGFDVFPRNIAVEEEILKFRAVARYGLWLDRALISGQQCQRALEMNKPMTGRVRNCLIM